MVPIFHLSFPVRDLDEALAFYGGLLGGFAGRREERWADVLLFDAQLTLQHDPAAVTDPMPRTRHFGATLEWSQWEALTTALAERVAFVEPPKISRAGSNAEQGKAMIADPSGNLIELKAYRRPEMVLNVRSSR